MSFSLRVALLVAIAVAIAAIGGGTGMYFLAQDQLIRQVDSSLADAAQSARTRGPRLSERFPFGMRPDVLLSGRADVFAQVVDANGSVVQADGGSVPALINTAVREVAAGTREAFLATVTFQDGERVRVLVTPFGTGRALEVARPLAEIDAVLAQTRLTLVVLGAGAILLAAVLGLLVSRAALAPVRRLSATVEEVTRTRDLSRRVGASGNDELARLASSFDAMLAQLEAALRSQRQLVADASHELRTPLTSLRTNLELLARGEPSLEGERQQMIGELVAQIERLTKLVSDLIDLARDEDAPLVVEDVRLDEIVQDALDDMRLRYPRVSFRVRSGPTTVRGVRPRLGRAVTNLLDNAAKWSPQGATVEVSVEDGELIVRDHGPGIAPEDAPHVFDRFWRASTARDLPGSGLGLAIVRDVAEAHGGSVTLERPMDGGARFRLRLA
ncbi:MAG TPA: HAMP domain-containing sensor histidine kinase [Candidatus Limnocylindria bacterium]|nr:HAMP domain-containing sensor histidine kinase [Candidatus Limnocylindria bacterium]